MPEARLEIQAIVDLLDRHRPVALADLRDRFPDSANLLEPGKRLGADSPPTLGLLKELATLTVESAKSESRELAEMMQRRLKRSAKLRLLSAIVSSLSSGGFIAALLQGSTTAALVTGVVAFVSSSLSVVAQYVEDHAGGPNSLRDMRDRVMTHVAAAIEIEGELKLMNALNTLDNLEPLIRKLNVTIASVRQMRLVLE